MKRKISTERFIILIGIIFIAIILVVNLFADFIPHTLKTADVHKAEITTQAVTTIPVMININTANVYILADLQNVGEQKAKNIVAYRRKHGKFRSVDDIVNVPGIGKNTLEMNKDRLTVE